MDNDSERKRLADEATERKLRNSQLGEHIAEYEAVFGVITDDKLAAAEKRWQESPL